MALKDETCGVCDAAFAKTDRMWPRPEVAWIRATCPGCSGRFLLCRLHYPVWVACSDACKEVWKKLAEKGLPNERLTGPTNPKERKPRGVAIHQGDMFKKS